MGGFLKRRVLIVDDDPVIHVSLLNILSSENIEVYSLHNPLDALKWLETSSVDLIICDIGLPKMNGLEFVRQIRKKNRMVGIVFFTGVTSQIKREDIIDLNVYSIVNKGDFDVFSFKKNIHQYLFESLIKVNQ